MYGYRGYLLDNDCYASLAVVLTQIQYVSVSRSHQLLRCMGTRLNPIEAGGGGASCAPCRFLPGFLLIFSLVDMFFRTNIMEINLQLNAVRRPCL